MPLNDNRRVAAASTRLTRRPGLMLALVDEVTVSRPSGGGTVVTSSLFLR